MTTAVVLPSAARSPQQLGQITAVEQARAVAEVAAAVQVAQQFPRDMDRVRAEVREACANLDFAKEAVYAVTNRGEGLSVHLARELASIYGNFQFGVHEMRRDDAAGESEIQSFAWDVERNTRSTRTFIQPHARMKAGKRQQLVDLHDIYLSNQNTGARALRECIFAALPKSLVREAEVLVRATIEKGDGKPAQDRLAAALNAFAGIGVKEPQLVARVGKRKGEWTPQDFASLEVVFGSIRRGDLTVDDAFPPVGVTVPASADPAGDDALPLGDAS